MVNHQVITFGKDGTVSGLQRKAGQGLDLRSFGKASIVRASEIVWEEEVQGWAIQIMDAPGLAHMKGVRVTADQMRAVGLRAKLTKMIDADKVMPISSDKDDACLFFEYDDAVAAEIMFLDAHRLAGAY